MLSAPLRNHLFLIRCFYKTWCIRLNILMQLNVPYSSYMNQQLKLVLFNNVQPCLSLLLIRMVDKFYICRIISARISSNWNKLLNSLIFLMQVESNVDTGYNYDRDSYSEYYRKYYYYGRSAEVYYSSSTGNPTICKMFFFIRGYMVRFWHDEATYICLKFCLMKIVFVMVSYTSTRYRVIKHD